MLTHDTGRPHVARELSGESQNWEQGISSQKPVLKFDWILLGYSGSKIIIRT